jgi:hypothetical protein
MKWAAQPQGWFRLDKREKILYKEVGAETFLPVKRGL